jgi:hypothetical protein
MNGKKRRTFERASSRHELSAISLAIATSVSLWNPPARADIPIDTQPAAENPAFASETETSQRWAWAGHLGLGTPLGFAGVAVEYTPVPFLTLAGGAGWGNSGPQLAFMPRVRPFDDLLAFGVGISAGPYGWVSCRLVCFGATSEKVWDRALWANVDLSFEGRSTKGVGWRWYLGGGRLLNPGSYRCERGTAPGWLGGTTSGPDCRDEDGLWIAYVGANFGTSL